MPSLSIRHSLCTRPKSVQLIALRLPAWLCAFSCCDQLARVTEDWLTCGLSRLHSVHLFRNRWIRQDKIESGLGTLAFLTRMHLRSFWWTLAERLSRFHVYQKTYRQEARCWWVGSSFKILCANHRYPLRLTDFQGRWIFLAAQLDLCATVSQRLLLRRRMFFCDFQRIWKGHLGFLPKSPLFYRHLYLRPQFQLPAFKSLQRWRRWARLLSFFLKSPFTHLKRAVRTIKRRRRRCFHLFPSLYLCTAWIVCNLMARFFCACTPSRKTFQRFAKQ